MALTRTATALGLAVLIVIGAALGYVGWRMYTTANSPACEVCRRPLHSHSLTVARVDDEAEETFCCPTCVVTVARQTGRLFEIVAFTDHVSGERLDPDTAVLVRGSNVNPCLQHEHEMLREREKQSVPLDFDRCSPSILAFAERQTAEEFARIHGGELLRLDDLQDVAAP